MSHRLLIKILKYDDYLLLSFTLFILMQINNAFKISYRSTCNKSQKLKSALLDPPSLGKQ